MHRVVRGAKPTVGGTESTILIVHKAESTKQKADKSKILKNTS